MELEVFLPTVVNIFEVDCHHFPRNAYRTVLALSSIMLSSGTGTSGIAWSTRLNVFTLI